MKILIYGAGVLGSQLAHVLICAGHDVTVLARGKRLKTIQNNGLVIRHYLQLGTTVDKVKTVSAFNKYDEYDIVFVVMQYQQIEAVLPSLAENVKTKNFVLMGNNPFPEKTSEYIHKNSSYEKNVYFGFFWAAGRIENNRVISAHTGSKHKGQMTIGALGNESLDIFKSLSESGGIKIDFQIDIDAWLKSHAVFVLPVCYAVYMKNGNSRLFSKELINEIIDAIAEGYNLLRSIGVTPAPAEDEDMVKNHRIKSYAFIKFCAATPIGKLIAVNHAMSAKAEMRALDKAFEELRAKSTLHMPVWEKMRRIMEEI